MVPRPLPQAHLAFVWEQDLPQLDSQLMEEIKDAILDVIEARQVEGTLTVSTLSTSERRRIYNDLELLLNDLGKVH